MTTRNQGTAPANMTRPTDTVARATDPCHAIHPSGADAEGRAVAALAAGTAYELEGPTCCLLNQLRVMQESRAPNASGDSLDRALRAAEHIEGVVRGLSAFNATSSSADGVDVHEALELALHLAMPAFANRATVRRLYGPVERVHGNLGRLALALLGVLRNAAASIPGGMPAVNTVFVRTGRSPDGYTTIDVADTGVGIEAADLEFVFDPFFTTKPRPDSLGLGLASIREAIREMGGSIEVESAVGHGTRVHVALPSEAGEPTIASYTRCDARPDRRVLCVARSAADSQQLGDLVEDDDTRIVFATIEDALLRLSTGETYDLVLCERGLAHETDFRERLSRMAPEAEARTFTVTVRGGGEAFQTRPALTDRSALASSVIDP